MPKKLFALEEIPQCLRQVVCPLYGYVPGIAAMASGLVALIIQKRLFLSVRPVCGLSAALCQAGFAGKTIVSLASQLYVARFPQRTFSVSDTFRGRDHFLNRSSL